VVEGWKPGVDHIVLRVQFIIITKQNKTHKAKIIVTWKLLAERPKST
jgi:hypothetical protein